MQHNFYGETFPPEKTHKYICAFSESHHGNNFSFISGHLKNVINLRKSHSSPRPVAPANPHLDYSGDECSTLPRITQCPITPVAFPHLFFLLPPSPAEHPAPLLPADVMLLVGSRRSFSYQSAFIFLWYGFAADYCFVGGKRCFDNFIIRISDFIRTIRISWYIF